MIATATATVNISIKVYIKVNEQLNRAGMHACLYMYDRAI